MKAFIIALATLLSLQVSADSMQTCKDKVRGAVESQIIASGSLIESVEGYANYEVKWMGDGFFDVSYLVWDKDPKVAPVNHLYEVVIGASCDIIYVQFVKDEI
jgi:hypothetical protein